MKPQGAGAHFLGHTTGVDELRSSLVSLLGSVPSVQLAVPAGLPLREGPLHSYLYVRKGMVPVPPTSGVLSKYLLKENKDLWLEEMNCTLVMTAHAGRGLCSQPGQPARRVWEGGTAFHGMPTPIFTVYQEVTGAGCCWAAHFICIISLCNCCSCSR